MLREKNTVEGGNFALPKEVSDPDTKGTTARKRIIDIETETSACPKPAKIVKTGETNEIEKTGAMENSEVTEKPGVSPQMLARVILYTGETGVVAVVVEHDSTPILTPEEREEKAKRRKAEEEKAKACDSESEAESAKFEGESDESEADSAASNKAETAGPETEAEEIIILS